MLGCALRLRALDWVSRKRLDLLEGRVGRGRERYEQYLTAGESDSAFHFDVGRVTQITVYVHAHALHDKFLCLGRLISLQHT
jgi:hypothetical protein